MTLSFAIEAVGPKVGAQIGACCLGSDLDLASFVAGVFVCVCVCVWAALWAAALGGFGR